MVSYVVRVVPSAFTEVSWFNYCGGGKKPYSFPNSLPIPAMIRGTSTSRAKWPFFSRMSFSSKCCRTMCSSTVISCFVPTSPSPEQEPACIEPENLSICWQPTSCLQGANAFITALLYFCSDQHSHVCRAQSWQDQEVWLPTAESRQLPLAWSLNGPNFA